MKGEIRLSLNVERDLVWSSWPEEADYDDLDTFEDEGMVITIGSPNQIVIE